MIICIAKEDIIRLPHILDSDEHHGVLGWQRLIKENIELEKFIKQEINKNFKIEILYLAKFHGIKYDANENINDIKDEFSKQKNKMQKYQIADMYLSNWLSKESLSKLMGRY